MTEGVGLGPVNQLLAVAEALVLRGTDCAFLVNESHANLLGRLGFRCFAAPAPTRGDPSAPDFRLSDAAQFLGILDPVYLRAAISAEIAAIDEFKPTVLMSATKLSTVASARARDLPLASIAATPDGAHFTSPLYNIAEMPNPRPVEIVEFFELYNVKVSEDVAELSFALSDLKVAASCPSFDPWLMKYGAKFVGPLVSKAVDVYTGLDAVGADPDVVVYINRGTVAVPEYMANIGLLAMRFPHYMFCIVEASPASVELPGNVIVVERAPIGRLLVNARVLISGGGQNAIVSALQSGVPVLGVQGTSAERDFNIRRATELGAGRTYQRSEPFAELLNHFEQLVSDPTYEIAAQTVSAELRALPGADAVANMLMDAPH